ncbi:GerW family sporulation protein [Paenibacillus sp. An7]|uniref:GerW family sporulation protein n=1 Tax=Paenibacillus sp. An7 TaxID=2689577 RepID=UPI001358078B|nr:GerW family sporulation protein [Paenibacillus sp. An7]
MSDHPIQGLMKTAMENIKAMVDVNTIVGDAVETPDGTVILPISRVGFGFAAGGSDFHLETEQQHDRSSAHSPSAVPFGGGSGGGVSIHPIAFLVVGKDGVNIVPLDNNTHLFEKIIDQAPKLIDQMQQLFKNNQTNTTTTLSSSQ